MKVKPKLYLNGSPQTAEEGSLAFARNMKIDNDGNLVCDYGYENIAALDELSIIGHIIGLDNKIYLFTKEKIVEYDEITQLYSTIQCSWTYSGGEITGCVNTNIVGETILTIAEYKEGIDIPIKHINLSHCSINDNESIYCQSPICPTANLILSDTYVKVIPNGVYLFFIRYKIRKDVYTDWFICSRPIFSGNSESINTFQGGLKYINLHKDSAKSFVFNLQFSQKDNIDQYKEFQLGFIITHDDATDARIWKSFDINTITIYFDYENIIETDIDSLLKTSYELYNVKNVTAFKNKLYISNYKETNFNPENLLKEKITDYIDIEPVVKSLSDGSDQTSINLGGYDLLYDSTSQSYNKTTSGLSISSIIQKKYFNYDSDSLIKLNTTEVKDAVVFNVRGKNNREADIAIINKIENKIYNNAVFGKNYDKPLYSGYTTDSGKLGFNHRPYSVSYYQPVIWNSFTDDNNHPWYNIGLTFAFGSCDENKINALDKAPFNAYNLKYNSVFVGHYGACWKALDKWFGTTGITNIKNTLKKEIKDRSFFVKTYIEVTYGAKSYKIGYKDIMDSDNYAGENTRFYPDITGSAGISGLMKDYKENPHLYYRDGDLEFIDMSFCSTDPLVDDGNENLYADIKYWVFEVLWARISGITKDGKILLNLSDLNGPSNAEISNVTIYFKKIEFNVESSDIVNTSDELDIEFKVSMKTTNYSALCAVSFDENILTINSKKDYIKQQPTLMPFTKYKAYIHLVDNHNIITNGIYLKDICYDSGLANNKIIILTYKRLKEFFDSNYKSFFISLTNIGDIIIEGFGYTKVENSNTHILNCLEIDTLLYNINDNITIIDSKNNVITNNAIYYSSGSSYPYLAFGNCGYVSWTSSEEYDSSKIFYIRITRKIEEIEKNTLIKASGFIPLSGENDKYYEIIDGYYDSWFCKVKKPDFGLCSSCYVSGNDVYSIDRNTLKLTEFSSYKQIVDSKEYYIKSNFNLNYLSLYEDIKDTIFSIGSASSGEKQVAKVINSSIISYIYELKSMYKDFFNKKFSSYEDNYKIEFDNTIRVSNVLSDETFNNSVFVFEAENYYNIPTNRGIIVKLFAIGNTIYAHTKGSLYKFDANQTIMSNNEDIKLQESEPFDIGLSQVFDSQYGYGGIENKEAGCVTFDSYFFYDSKNNHIFAYNGNNQLQLIDGSIYKFLTHFKPENCKILHDNNNNRILFEFYKNIEDIENGIFYTDYPIRFVLSYNYKSKSFVSFHDITLNNTFSTRNFVYSYNNTIFEDYNPLLKLFNSEYKNWEDLNAAFTIKNIYGNATVPCNISFEYCGMIYNKALYKQESSFVVDIIMFPKQYITEVINNITYLSYENNNIVNLESELIEDDTSIANTMFLWYKINNSNVENKNPVKKLYIVSDSCVSTVVNESIDDTERPNSLLQYKGFKYDKGFWNVNYFRDANNAGNIYNYPNQTDSDKSSLIYGRFFILNFEFTEKFPVKFEEVFINSEKY